MNNETINTSTQATTETAKVAPAAPVEKSWLSKTADAIEDHPVTAACVTFAGVCLASCLICWAAGGYENGNVA